MDAEKSVGESTDVCRVRNPEGTKRAVLCAACKLFTERGFAGTSMRDIAQASGVSQPLIHHHFGGKDDLYAAVRRSIVEAIVARDPEVVLATDRPADIRAELVRLFEFVRENESLLRMMAWSRLEGKHRMTAADLELKQAMVRRVEIAQRMGLVRNDMDPRFVVVMIQGCVCHWLENREFHADLFDGNPDDEAYLHQAIALLERGLGVGGGVTGAKGMVGTRRKRDPAKSQQHR
jgi:TetR/AcrR family transcriptional regulator